MSENQINIKKIVPADQLFHVEYEELVADPQRQLRKVANFLQLEVNESELASIQSNPRPVKLLPELEKRKFEIAERLNKKGIKCKIQEKKEK